MLFLGIDPSLTGSGLVVIDEKYEIVATMKLSTPTTGVERLYHLELKFLEFLEKYEKDLCLACVEGPAMREEGRLFNLGEWFGIFTLLLYKKRIETIIATPLQLKKFVSGVGKNQGKSVVILDVYKNFGQEIRDNDIADAYVLSRICRDFYCMINDNCGPLEVTKYQLEVLKKIESSREQENKSLL